MGWAISSFTNKLGSASGNIEPNSDGTLPTQLERSSSTPPANEKPARPQSHTMPSAPAVPRTSSNLRTVTSTLALDVEDEDFGDRWGDLDDNDTSVVDAWGTVPTSPLATASQSTKSVTPYDDGGEPDFEGWLNAQAVSKSNNNKALPKGLAKKAPVSKAAQGKPQTTVKASPATKAVPAKRAPEKKQEVVEDDDDWGEAWG
jgi:SCY1-like protein 1